jgi:D-alanine-D-alanine ligase
MIKKNIAVVYGGYSSEEVVSQRSAEGILSFIDTNKYNLFPLLMSPEKWVVIDNNQEYIVNKADFTVIIDQQVIRFDCAYITIHGTPGEDGLLQGYLKLLNIPHSTCEVLPAALTFNKYTCNNYLKGFGITIAMAALVRKGITYNIEDIAHKTGFPCFVKPNAGGSSFGITKVKALDDLDAAIQKAFIECHEVVIEQFIEGTEVTCGLYKTADKAEILPITEIISKNEFFDFEAKYTAEKVTEITPARIGPELTAEIQNTSSLIYDLLNCKGIVRIDFIISDNQPFLLEVNTTPGMTPTSFIPQQIRAKGLDIKTVFNDVIEDAIARG